MNQRFELLFKRGVAALSVMILALTIAVLVLLPSSAAAQASVTPSTVRTEKGDLVTGDAAAFAEALEQIGLDGEVMVWIKETGTPRPRRRPFSTFRARPRR
jgi:hypothetical protein